ncbi:hypothetical protein B0H16DRAFT_1684366 [Mycena metata]|uniref:Uncharacterized protein n=1 Tax=Mycena metata TaxID=1033252 RepID=A0AAD7NUA1_9AGAR|nr:hypothetical protein B0H16DRAFT_1684366 [Mycena metata]
MGSLGKVQICSTSKYTQDLTGECIQPAWEIIILTRGVHGRRGTGSFEGNPEQGDRGKVDDGWIYILFKGGEKMVMPDDVLSYVIAFNQCTTTLGYIYGENYSRNSQNPTKISGKVCDIDILAHGVHLAEQRCGPGVKLVKGQRHGASRRPPCDEFKQDTVAATVFATVSCRRRRSSGTRDRTADKAQLEVSCLRRGQTPANVVARASHFASCVDGVVGAKERVNRGGAQAVLID